MRNPFAGFPAAFNHLRLVIRYRLPWRTKGYLRDECRRLSDERDANMAGLKAISKEFGQLNQRFSDQATELNDTREELKGERNARVELEGQRIEEHQAVSRLAFGLSNGLEATLGLVNEFIVGLPDYKPDQEERAQVMQGLTRQVH